jgi:hypothetical protein
VEFCGLGLGFGSSFWAFFLIDGILRMGEIITKFLNGKFA